jgi:hypothetical protein
MLLLKKRQIKEIIAQQKTLHKILNTSGGIIDALSIKKNKKSETKRRIEKGGMLHTKK